jgi:hypothetical protein
MWNRENKTIIRVTLRQAKSGAGECTLKATLYHLAWFLLIASSLACGQQTAGPTFLANQEIRVTGLPARAASSTDLSAVLSAALEMIFHDPDVCCGRNSALQAAALSTDTLSLTELAAKIEGKYTLDDGRRITITTEYLPPNAISPSKLLGPMKRNQASLIEWKSFPYVLYGAIFDEVQRLAPKYITSKYINSYCWMLDFRMPAEKSRLIERITTKRISRAF